MANAHEFAFAGLAGGAPITLKDYSGRVVLIVNVASACGYTPQYRELESLYEAKAKDGLVVIGVPCNEFGRQESGAEAEIAKFCADAYRVTFPMAAKTEIIGQGRHPFFQWVAREAGEAALPRWNFHKYLIGKDGDLIEAFPSKAAPLGREMLAAVESALAA
jgi:glutathione peroxidase